MAWNQNLNKSIKRIRKEIYKLRKRYYNSQSVITHKVSNKKQVK